jgi:CRP-like cAMP-binding protein
MPSTGAVPAEIAKALGRIYLFQEFDAASVARIAHAAEVLRVSQGDTIAKEGDPGDALFIVASGSVRVWKADESGASEQVVVLTPGQHVGESSVLDGAPRSASVVAAETTELYRLPWERLKPILDSDSRLAASFYRALAQAVTSRLRATTDDIAFLKHLTRGDGKPR